MLNPFAIEKDTLLKTAAIRQLSINIQRILAEQILASQQHIDPIFKKELQPFVPSEPFDTKTYECRICRKVFDDGRKLGGHVSRAHKAEIEQQYAGYDQSSEYVKNGRKEQRSQGRQPKRFSKISSIRQSLEML